MGIRFNLYIRRFSLVMLFAVLVHNSFAVVLHPGGEPASDFSNINIPDPNVMGRWGNSCSCVAIGRNLVITTTHQDNYNASVLKTVQIGGVYYECSQVWTTSENNDVRIVKLQHANLPAYVDIYTGNQEVSSNMVLGGFGRLRGETLYDDNMPYAYTWASGYNTKLRFGENKIISIANSSQDTSYVCADFDELGYDEARTFEGIAAQSDSGGGWFIYSGNKWRLAGITNGVTHLEESWFYDPVSNQRMPDKMFGWRVSELAEWINPVMISEAECPYIETDLTDDCIINTDDLAAIAGQWGRQNCGVSNNYCQGADINHNGKVWLEDFALIAADWLNEYDSSGNVVLQ